MLEVGTTFIATVKVDSSNTALAMGSGDLEVFATPALVALMERAAASLVADALAEPVLAAQESVAESFGSPVCDAEVPEGHAAGQSAIGRLLSGNTTVGAAIDITHIKPTAIGGTVTAKAELTAIEGRKLTFRVEAWDGGGTVGEGTHGTRR